MVIVLVSGIGASLVACHKEPEEAPPTTLALEMFEPEAGEMVRAGATTVRGEAKGLTDIRVDGVPMALDGTLWQGEVDLPRGITTFEITGRTASGDLVFERQSVLAGDFGDADDPTVRQAVAVRANQGALDAATGLVADFLDVDALNALLPAMNPVYEDSYGVFGIDAVTIAADIGSVWFAPPRITLDPGAGALAIEIELPDLQVAVPVRGEVVGIDFDTDVTLEADLATVTGLLEVHADRGDLAAELIAPELTLDGFSFDLSALPGSIEDALLADTIRDVVTDLINEQMVLLVPGLLDEQLAGLDIAFETELFGRSLSLAAAFDTVAMDQNGLFLIADLDVDVGGAKVKQTEGYLLAGAGAPRPSTSPDLAVVLADDVVNKLLHDLWRSGMLDLTLSTDDGSLEAFYLTPFGAKDEGAITLDAGLPPVLVQGERGAVLQLGELVVRVDTPDGENGSYLVASVAGEIPLDVSLEDGALELALGEPELVLMVRDNDWGAENEIITGILTEELPIDLLLALIGDLEIPMPTIGELTIPDAEVGRDDAGTWTTMAMAF